MATNEAGDRTIVTGKHAGSIFPREERTVAMALRLDGTARPFEVEGAVYARELEANGEGVVAGPVLARGDVTLSNLGQGGTQRFLGGVSTRGNLAATCPALPLGQSLTARIGAARFIFRGEVIAENVALHNAIVFGNVRARRVTLDSCIVLGAVIGHDIVELRSSAFAALDGRAVTLLGRCSCFIASGTSRTPYVFGVHKDGAGRAHPFGLRHLALCRSVEAGCGFGRSEGGQYLPDQTIACKKHADGTCAFGQVRLVGADFVQADGVRKVGKVAGAQTTTVEEPVPLHVLSIAGRALNLRPIATDAELVGSVLRAVLEYDHYDDPSRAHAEDEWHKTLSPDEVSLLRLATSGAAAYAP